MTIFKVVVIACCFYNTSGVAQTLASFRTCIGSGGSGSTCAISAGTHDIDTTLQIERSGITIEGTVGDATQVIFRRTSLLGRASIMAINTSAVSSPILTIRSATFDGNRQLNSGTVPLCSSSGGPADLDLWDAGIATVQYINFISAPWDALHIGGSQASGVNASTVSYSNFGQGFSSMSRTAPQTATRWFGILAQGNSTGIYYNNIAYVGLAAIDLYSGFGQYVIGNQMNSNRYEQPDGISGGGRSIYRMRGRTPETDSMEARVTHQSRIT